MPRVAFSDLAIFIAFSKTWNGTITFRLFRKNAIPSIISTLEAFRWILFEKFWSSSFGGSTGQIFHRENSRTKHIGVCAYGKIHCERGTAYSAAAYWFLAMINDSIDASQVIPRGWARIFARKSTKLSFLGCTENHFAIWQPSYVEYGRVTGWNGR